MAGGEIDSVSKEVDVVREEDHIIISVEDVLGEDVPCWKTIHESLEQRLFMVLELCQGF